MTAQVSAVNKALMSVSRIATTYKPVVSGDDGSFIEDKETGERMWMTQAGGMYSLKMCVPRNYITEAGFLRRGEKRVRISKKGRKPRVDVCKTYYEAS